MEVILRLELALSVLERRAADFKEHVHGLPYADKRSRHHYIGAIAATEFAADLLKPIIAELKVEEEPFASAAEKAQS